MSIFFTYPRFDFVIYVPAKIAQPIQSHVGWIGSVIYQATHKQLSQSRQFILGENHQDQCPCILLTYFLSYNECAKYR